MIGQSAGKSFAYILGVFLGDGCVTYTGQPAWKYLSFRLNTIDRDFAEAAVEALERLTGQRPNIRRYPEKRGSDYHAICLRHQELCEKLVADTDRKAKIPDYVWGWSLDEKRAFIAGLMDSEGYVAANRGNPTNRRWHMGFRTSAEWVGGFARLLETIGVQHTRLVWEKPYKPGYRPAAKLAIKMQSWIDAGCYFNIARKQERVKDFASAGPYERRAKRPRRLTSETSCSTPVQG